MAAQSPTKPATKPYLLILEDDAAIGEMLVTAFEESGYKVKLTQDGKLARTAIRLERFDYMILDINVPSMTGLQVAAFAKSSDLNRATPLCIASGKIDGDAEKRIAKLKIGHVASKPYSINKLLAEVDKAIKRSRDPGVSYDARIINGFITGTIEVLKYYMGEDPQKGQIRIKSKSESAPGVVSALMSFTAADARGSMNICVNGPFIKRFVAKLFDGAEVDITAESIADMIGEFCNQVLGAIKREFSKIGVSLALGLPEVVMGKDHQVIHKVINPVIQIPFTMGEVSCTLEFCLEKLDIETGEAEEQGHQEAGKVLMF